MSIKIKAQEEIITDIIRSIVTNTGNGIATYENSDAYDIHILPLAQQVYDTNLWADFVSRSRSLDELESVVRDPDYQNQLAFVLNLTFSQTQQLISLTIDNLVSNWNMTRLSAIVSRGIIRLYLTKGDAITLSSGIPISTADGLQFITTNSFVNFTPEYDSLQGLYYIDSAIQSVNTGSINNVEVGAINIISYNGIQSAVNLERTKFGTDQETDLELIDRARTAWKSREISVFSGIFTKVLGYPGVIDASIIMPSDPLQVRNEKNAVDIYLLAQPKYQLKNDYFNIVSARYAWETINSELNYDIYPIPDSTTDITFKILSQPVVSVSSASYSDSPSGTFSSILENNYSFVEDTTGVWAKSVRGNDTIVVKRTALPITGYLKVDYLYDRLYLDLQNMLKNYETSIIGADILFKKAIEESVNITVIPTIFLGNFTLQDVQNTIQSDLNIFFNGGTDSNGVQRIGFKLGQKVDKSDLIVICSDVQGVDFIDVANFSVKINGVEIGSTYLPDINKYLRLGNVTFTLPTGTHIGTITGTGTGNTNNQSS